MISRMQLPREMYMGGGISSLPYPSYGYAGGGITNLPNYMGGGYIDEYGRQRYGFGKFVKKITKPIAKVLDKVVPNEIKPALPYLAAFAPFMFPAFTAGLGSMLGGSGTIAGLSIPNMIGAGVLKAGADLSQEGAAERGLNLPSLALSAAQGYLAAPGASETLEAGKIIGNVGDKVITAGDLSNYGTSLSSNVSPEAIRGLSLTEGSSVYNTLQNLTGATELQPYVSGITSPTFSQGAENWARGIGSIGAKTLDAGRESFENIIGGSTSGKDFLNVGQAYVPGALVASGEVAYNAAKDAQKAYQNELLAMGNLAGANKQDQINYIRRAMVSAGFNEDEIVSAISRSGFMYGGNVEEGFAQGGLMNLRMGGMPAEMDLRKGGFVPLGKKERADDVPARLSKNEFVFTAKAVRNAGGGDVRKGAKRMYQIMNQLEARS